MWEKKEGKQSWSQIKMMPMPKLPCLAVPTPPEDIVAWFDGRGDPELVDDRKLRGDPGRRG